MLVLVDTAVQKAWEAYTKASAERVYQYSAISLFLLVYLILMLIASTPRVSAYNGVDMWYALVDQAPGGTFLVSAFLIAFLVPPVIHDLRGTKTNRELREDKKKPKDKVQPKKPFQVNWYYVGGLFLEGLIYGSLTFALLPDLLRGLFLTVGDPADVPIQFDAVSSLWAYHSNVGQDIALAFGAGVYEEMIFRSLLFMGIIKLAKGYGKKNNFLKQFNLQEDQLRPFPLKVPKFNKKSGPYRLLILLGCGIYAASHFFLPFADHLSVFGFVYRLCFGFVMYLIFTNRNPAVAVWTHVVYDLLYFSLRWFM